MIRPNGSFQWFISFPKIFPKKLRHAEAAEPPRRVRLEIRLGEGLEILDTSRGDFPSHWMGHPAWSFNSLLWKMMVNDG